MWLRNRKRNIELHKIEMVEDEDHETVLDKNMGSISLQEVRASAARHERLEVQLRAENKRTKAKLVALGNGRSDNEDTGTEDLDEEEMSMDARKAGPIAAHARSAHELAKSREI